MTCNEIQDEIIEQFSLLDGDKAMTTEYLIELGRKLPQMDEIDKIEENLIKGCMSKVWLTANFKNGKVYFNADSNTQTIKGLISLLVKIFNGQSPESVLSTELYFFNKLGLERFITAQRTGGFSAMIKQMKWYALAFKTKMETA